MEASVVVAIQFDFPYLTKNIRYFLRGTGKNPVVQEHKKCIYLYPCQFSRAKVILRGDHWCLVNRKAIESSTLCQGAENTSVLQARD